MRVYWWQRCLHLSPETLQEHNALEGLEACFLALGHLGLTQAPDGRFELIPLPYFGPRPTEEKAPLLGSVVPVVETGPVGDVTDNEPVTSG